MNSEEVKEIKKTLKFCASLKKSCRDCPYSEIGCYKLVKDTLILINVLESENKELKKYRTNWLNSEKMHLQAELEDTEFELASSNRMLKKIIKEIIDKVDDMIGGKMIAQALREIYLEVK